MDIGKEEKRRITVERIKNPVPPKREPAPPDREPVPVPKPAREPARTG
jgi:hypothetical protein